MMEMMAILMKAKYCWKYELLRGSSKFISGTFQTCNFSLKSVVEKRVYRSSSNNIFSNLALEEWLYENADLTETDILLIWQNSPAVVIGRHQNPWLETNVSLSEKENVIIARRSSGGGAVYHDLGNLNLSFIKGRARYNRKDNLNLVVKALTSRWNIDLKINERDDIILDGFYKISGTAAKVGRSQTYHHFTLLHDVDEDRLDNILKSPMYGSSSRSTKSVPALVKNLKEADPSMSIDAMVDVVADVFLKEAQAQSLLLIDPQDEQQFPNVKKICQRLQSWDWLYGKTPSFSIQRMFSMPSSTGFPLTVDISINIEKGCVSSLALSFNEPQLVELCWQLTNVFENNFLNVKLTPENVKALLEHYSHFSKVQVKQDSHKQIIALWTTDCLDACFQFL